MRNIGGNVGEAKLGGGGEDGVENGGERGTAHVSVDRVCVCVCLLLAVYLCLF